MQLVKHTVCNMRDLLGTERKAVDVIDGGGDVSLTHSSGIHREHFSFNGRNVRLSFGNDLRCKRAVTVSWDADGNLACRGFEDFGGISVAAICCILFASLVAHVTEMVFHLAIEHGFKHGTEDFFEGVLHVFYTLGLILFDNCLSERCTAPWGPL